MRSVLAGSFIPRAPGHGRSLGRHGSHFNGEGARRTHDAGLRPARLPRPSDRSLINGSVDQRAAATQIRVVIADSYRGEYVGSAALRASRFQNDQEIRSRRLAGIKSSSYFFARSFKSPFSSSMNSFTSLKSRYTDAKRT